MYPLVLSIEIREELGPVPGASAATRPAPETPPQWGPRTLDCPAAATKSERGQYERGQLRPGWEPVPLHVGRGRSHRGHHQHHAGRRAGSGGQRGTDGGSRSGAPGSRSSSCDSAGAQNQGGWYGDGAGRDAKNRGGYYGFNCGGPHYSLNELNGGGGGRSGRGGARHRYEGESSESEGLSPDDLTVPPAART